MNQELEQAVVKYGNDTWEDGYGQGVYEERERIIKLLEVECERPLDPKWEHYRETCSCSQIALIKGEKK